MWWFWTINSCDYNIVVQFMPASSFSTRLDHTTSSIATGWCCCPLSRGASGPPVASSSCLWDLRGFAPHQAFVPRPSLRCLHARKLFRPNRVWHHDYDWLPLCTPCGGVHHWRHLPVLVRDIDSTIVLYQHAVDGDLLQSIPVVEGKHISKQCSR